MEFNTRRKESFVKTFEYSSKQIFSRIRTRPRNGSNCRRLFGRGNENKKNILLMINVIVGKSGFGKTFFTKKIIEKLNSCFVVDTKSEYDLIPIFSFNEFKTNIEQKKYSMRFSDWNDYFLMFEYLRRNCKNFTLVIDELGLFVDSKSGNKSLNDMTLIHKEKCNLFYVTQSARFISTIMLTQANSILVFHLKKAEIENLSKKVALNDDEILKIENLQVGEKIRIE